MSKHTLLVSLIVLAAASAVAQEVYVDYDRSGRFSWYKTWAWAKTEATSLEGHNDLMHSRIKNAIEYHISQGRLVEDTDNPQLFITYHAGSREAVRVDPVSFGVGFGGSWVQNPYWGGVGISTTGASTYEQGTLIIDIWEAEGKKLVWRGVAIDVFVDDPKKADKKINKAIEKMIKKWRKMKPGL
jgi:hypothetical protein